ncbi:MAG TPA: 1,4-dihydroxy-2-naphthoate polyprenyltransferase [Acidimicrobiales bacterium]
MTPPGPLQRWILAARVRTLPAAAVPVVIGASLARPHTYNVLNTLLCLIVALALQIGTNYANDYSDGVRGTDEVRVGPFRLTASKLVPPLAVKRAAFLFFTVAAVAGLFLSIRSTWVFIPLGMSAVAAGWFYTGGPKPYGYIGLGELFVMIYFGFVATVGTAFTQHGHVPAGAWWWGLATGSMACALLEANNLRDVRGDREAGKKTLAARLGRRRASWLYAVWVVLAILGAAFGGEALVGAVALAMYIPALQLAFSPKTGRELLPLLKQSAQAQWAVGAATAIVMFVTR